MRHLWSIIITLCTVGILTGGCAGLTHTIQPPPGLPQNWQEGHYISPIGPQLATHVDLGFFRYLKWEGQEPFTSWSIQPFGTASRGESKRPCFQVYWGVKIDATETFKLLRLRESQHTDPSPSGPFPPYLWDYVYTPAEQWAVRWRWNSGCGYPDVWDMGGS